MPQEVDVLKISNDDAAFILGKSGRTKEKIARVSGAELDLFEQSLTLEIRGSEAERRRAKKCAHAPPPPPSPFSRTSQEDPPPPAGTSSASWRSASAPSPSTTTARTTT